MRITGIRHTCITVKDMDKMVDFYMNLGMNKMVRNRVEEGEYFDNSTGLKDAKAHVVYLEADDGSLLELLKFLKPEDIDYSHVSFDVIELEGAKESPYNPVRAKFIKDPEGNWMECVEEL